MKKIALKGDIFLALNGPFEHFYIDVGYKISTRKYIPKTNQYFNMKKINLVFLLLFVGLMYSCRVKVPSNCFPEMTEVNVHSGTIKNLIFQANSDYTFNWEDDAIGLIDSNTVCTKKNALYDYNNYVYIFEKNELPNVLGQGLYFQLRNANWKKKKQYLLKEDAEILVDEFEFKIYIREKNYGFTNKMYVLDEATVNGQKVYRYWDEYYIEDYKNFRDYHHLLRPPHIGEIMIDKIRGINASEFTTTPGATNRPVLTVDGRVDYTSPYVSPTPTGTTDKIYFRKPGAAVNYRIKHVYHTPEFRRSIEKFYDAPNSLIKGEYVKTDVVLARRIPEGPNGKGDSRIVNIVYDDVSKPDTTNKLIIELREFYDPYLEKNIEGYQLCSGAVRNLNRSGKQNVTENLVLKILAEIDSPPLPTGGGGE